MTEIIRIYDDKKVIRLGCRSRRGGNGIDIGVGLVNGSGDRGCIDVQQSLGHPLANARGPLENFQPLGILAMC
jgi:hypothetical protein